MSSNESDRYAGAKAPFRAFTSDPQSIMVLRQFALAQGWDPTVIHEGDIATATAYLKSNPSPLVLCVDVHTAESAPAALDALADVCSPTIKVLVSGKINEYSFYCWLVEVGVSSYLLQPFTLSAIESAYAKAVHVMPVTAVPAAEVSKEARIITVIGARGGVGATTVSVNMAWILANDLHQKTALLDFDPQLGTVALALDLEPGRGLRDALEKPERIDGLFLDRVMVRIDDNLSILSTEEALEEHIHPTGQAAQALFLQAKPKFSYIVVDVPRTLTDFTRHAIEHANDVICVTEFSIMGLRESLRYLEYCRDTLKIKPPVFVANRVGAAGKHQMPQEEFEKGLGAKVSYSIPFLPEAYAASIAGDVLAETSRNAPATKVLHALASQFVPGAEMREPETKMNKLLAFIKGGK